MVFTFLKINHLNRLLIAFRSLRVSKSHIDAFNLILRRVPEISIVLISTFFLIFLLIGTLTLILDFLDSSMLFQFKFGLLAPACHIRVYESVYTMTV